MSKIHDTTEALKAKIAEQIQLPENGVAAEDPLKTVWRDNLPEGLTPEMWNQFGTYNSTFAAAGSLALGDAALPQFKQNADLTRASMTVPLEGKDAFHFTVDRSKERPIPSQDGVAGVKTVYGVAQVSLDVYGLGRRGQVAAVRNHLAELYEKELGC